MDFIHTVVSFLIAIVILVTVHEWGHFMMARLCGVKVLRFSIGFGTPLLKWIDKKGTEFAIAPIPLGGYVKMLDEREGEVAPEELHLAFTRKTPWQRIAIAFAGPAINLIMAVLLYWFLLGTQGRDDLIPFVGEIAPESVAAQARLELGQEIVAIDGKPTPTQRSVELRLVERLGETGVIRFAVRYPDSDSPDLIYESEAHITDWMKGVKDPEPLKGIGLTFKIPPVLGLIIENGPAQAAGFKTGDEVLFADDVPIETWYQWVEYVQARPNRQIDVLIERDGREQNIRVTPEEVEDETTGKILGKIQAGAQIPETYIRRVEYSFLGAAVEGVKETKNTVLLIMVTLKKLIFGEISFENLAGVITIAKVAGSTASAGLLSFISFLAYLSVMLGVINLMPIPVLDGGHILYCLVEAVKGSPVSERVQMIGYQVGLFMIVGVMLLALYNDILRL